MDIELEAIFQSGDVKVKVTGFYDGKGVYKIRFSPDITGRWSYQTISNSETLNNKKGSFTCIEPGPENHGPLKDN